MNRPKVVWSRVGKSKLNADGGLGLEFRVSIRHMGGKPGPSWSFRVSAEATDNFGNSRFYADALCEYTTTFKTVAIDAAKKDAERLAWMLWQTKHDFSKGKDT